MIKHTLFAAASAICLSACGSGDKVDLENASVNDVAKELRKADANEGFVKPGQWEQTVTLVEMSVPGAPPQVAEALKKQTGQSQVHKSCLTPEQANHPREDFFSGADKSCRYDHFKWGSGKVDMKLDCKHESGTQTMELAGTYEPESYQMVMSVASRGSNPMDTMNMKMQVDAKRVGQCTDKEG